MSSVYDGLVDRLRNLPPVVLTDAGKVLNRVTLYLSDGGRAVLEIPYIGCMDEAEYRGLVFALRNGPEPALSLAVAASGRDLSADEIGNLITALNSPPVQQTTKLVLPQRFGAR